LLAVDSLRAVLQTIPGFRLFASLGTPSNGTITYCADCTAASPTAGGGTGNIVARENGVWNALRSGTGTGETNTASNVGTGAGLVFKQKTGVDLEFKRLAAGTNVTVTNGTSDVTVALPGNIALPDSGRFNKGVFVGGQFVSKILKGASASPLDFDLSGGSASQELTFTLAGVAAGDIVFLGIPTASADANVVYTVRCSATDTVAVLACRLSGSLPNPGSGTFSAVVFK